MKVVPYRCSGRFCTTCSCGETEEWSRVLAEDVFQVNHRHLLKGFIAGLHTFGSRINFNPHIHMMLTMGE